jgi:3-hydroxyisobutyrate dehydrogenase-like beta-hydroxyacid dehydrogenase
VTTILLLGLGEVGTVLAEDIGAVPDIRLRAWDTGFADPDSPATHNATRLGIRAQSDATSAARGADLVISAVTAANARTAAASVVSGLDRDTWFLDLNSAAPEQKQQAARTVERAGGCYVEAAVMSPITPKRLAAPILLGGPHATEFAGYAKSLGFTGVDPFADTVGPASATKLCRSVVVKGVEALVMESMLAARAWGVQDRVIDSLGNLLPADDWAKLAHYLISRSVDHGTRRAEEMREAAATVAGTGIEPVMSLAAARRQDWAATHRNSLTAPDLLTMLDEIKEETNG